MSYRNGEIEVISQIKVQEIPNFVEKLKAALQANRHRLSYIEQEVWKRHNRWALLWNKYFGNCIEATVDSVEYAAANSLWALAQRYYLEQDIEEQESLLTRLEYALATDSFIMLEDSDYELLERN